MRAETLRLWKRSTWTAVIVLFIVDSLPAQAPSSTEVPPPTIRVSTHMVLVDVVVTDKQGKAVQGLHAEDFVIEENGKQQKGEGGSEFPGGCHHPGRGGLGRR